jgi:hypothetical protein
MVYVKLVCPAHGLPLLLAIIEAGDGGTVVDGVTTRLLITLAPQPLTEVTLIVPAEVPAITKIVGFPWPETMVQPVGTLQVYVDVPGWAGTE